MPSCNWQMGVTIVYIAYQDEIHVVLIFAALQQSTAICGIINWVSKSSVNEIIWDIQKAEFEKKRHTTWSIYYHWYGLLYEWTALDWSRFKALCKCAKARNKSIYHLSNMLVSQQLVLGILMYGHSIYRFEFILVGNTIKLD